MLDPKATKHGYRFQRVFTDGEFLGAGLLVIPPGEKKPLKPAKDNTYVRVESEHWYWATGQADFLHLVTLGTVLSSGSGSRPSPSNRILSSKRRLLSHTSRKFVSD